MKLLVSVRDVTEAQLAVDTGIDIVDVKEPANGALGRADFDVIKNIGTLFGKRSILSVALGELNEFPFGEASVFADVVGGFEFSKIALAGLANSGWRTRLQEFESELPPSTQLVVVSYVDYFNCNAPQPDEVVQFAIDQSMPIILFDTFEKKQKCIFDYANAATLTHLIQRSRQFDVQVAIAGSIRKTHLPKIQKCQPDVVGVRGAGCRGDRQGALDRVKLIDFKDCLLGQVPAHSR